MVKLINAYPIPKPFEETTLEEMDRVIDINIRGVFIATQAALKHMKSGGRIITIGSAVGSRIVPGRLNRFMDAFVPAFVKRTFTAKMLGKALASKFAPASARSRA